MRPLVDTPVTPNQITTLRLAVGLGAAGAFAVGEPSWTYGGAAAFLASMLLFTLGLWTRYTAFLSWAGAMSYVQRASLTVFGMDAMMMILLTYLMIGPAGATFSLDRWLLRRRCEKRGLPVPAVEPSIRAAVLFPEPAGPSMVTIMAGRSNAKQTFLRH